MIETIKSYLVSLGFNVDAGSYQAATKAMGNVEQGVAKFAGSAITKFSLAGAAVTAFVATASIGIAKFIGDLAQADLANEKMARQLWMSKDAAAAYNNTLKAMGVTLQDLYLSPELMRNFQMLQQQARDLRAPQEFNEQMKMIRSVQFEFSRMKLEATYALQWIGYYFIKYMEGPIKSIKLTLSDINDKITKTMPSWTKIIAQVMSWFARMGITAFRWFKDLIRIFNDLGSAIPRNLKLIGTAIAALGLIFTTGPFGIIAATLLSIILLLDDFYTYLDGGESQFGSFWKKLDDFYQKLKGDGVVDAFKKNWDDALKSVSGWLDAAGKEAASFYKNLDDRGALKNFEDAFKNTFEIIGTLLDGAKRWVQDLYKELENQGVLKDLKTSFGDVTSAVSELAKTVTEVVKNILGFDETKDTLNGIGDIMKNVVIARFKELNTTIRMVTDSIKALTSLFKLDFSSAADSGSKVVMGQIEQQTGMSSGLLGSIKKVFTGGTKSLSNDEEMTMVYGLLDYIDRMSFGLISPEVISNMANRFSGGSGAPGYTLPSSNTQNNNTTNNLSPTYNIYSSDAKSGMDAAKSNYDGMYRNMSGVVR